MTIAVAYAIRENEANGFWLAADSRLTVNQNRTQTDAFVKTIDLLEGTAMVIAGSTLPSTAAAEFVRPLIANHNRVSGQERISFYDTCRIFAYFARRIYLDVTGGAEADALLCGFYQDGSPGLAHLRLKDGLADFYKPERGGRCGVVIGDATVRPLIEDGLARARGQPRGFDEFISLLYTIIKHEGEPYRGIGGGLAFGFCVTPDQPVQWPTIKIDGEVFYRGLPVRDFSQPSWQKPIVVHLVQEFADSVEREFSDTTATSIPAVPPRATWPIDGASGTDLFRASFDPLILQQD